MKLLWAPWRVEYIKTPKEKGCFLCKSISDNDDDGNLVLWRGKFSFVIMNLFPYNNGHLMVVPYKHTGDLNDLVDEEMLDVMSTVRLCVNVLKKEMKPDGFNIGVNIGRAAGAGVIDHLHYHVVPRWHGDMNFMPVLSDVKVIPEHIETTYDILKKAFNNHK